MKTVLAIAFLAFILAVLTSSCVGDGPPTKAERCAGYRITLDAARNLKPGEARDNRIAIYNALVEECKRAGL